MFGIFGGAVRAFWSAIIDARSMALENMALRHQLGVLERKVRCRPRLTPTDRMLWVWLSRTWSEWKDVLCIVHPETVIAWHRRGWWLYWIWRSKRRGPGRPTVPHDIRKRIREMSAANVLWGAPRVHGELPKLGIDVSQATVTKYMVGRNKPPSQSWRTFLDNHVTTESGKASSRCGGIVISQEGFQAGGMLPPDPSLLDDEIVACRPISLRSQCVMGGRASGCPAGGTGGRNAPQHRLLYYNSIEVEGVLLDHGLVVRVADVSTDFSARMGT